MVKLIQQWQCDICQRLHDNEPTAQACETVGIYDVVPGIEVGSVVVCPSFSYGWHDRPDTCWVMKNAKPLSQHIHLYVPIWVVTAIHPKMMNTHQQAYSLLCPVSPGGGIWFRWNCQSTHHKMELLTEPGDGIRQWMEENFEAWRGKVAKNLL